MARPRTTTILCPPIKLLFQKISNFSKVAIFYDREKWLLLKIGYPKSNLS